MGFMATPPDYHALQNQYVDYLRNFDDYTGPWLDLYCETYPDAPDNNDVWNACYAYTVLVPKDQVDKVIDVPRWEWNCIAHPPGFQVTSSSEGDELPRQPQDNVIDSYRYTDDLNADIGKRLVVFQDYDSIRPPNMPELSEDFRIYHNLWISADRSKAYKINLENGTDNLVARISPTKIQVRTPLVRQYLAGRQYCLVKYVDARALGTSHDNSHMLDTIYIESGKYHIERTSSEDVLDLVSTTSVIVDEDSIYSRIRGKAAMHPGNFKESGLYPYYDPHDWEKLGQGYKEFIIGENKDGSPKKFTSDPDLLGNYFGANPDAPHYLTPVYFDKKVLEKYERDTRYRIEPRSIRCGTLWLVRVDNDHADYVMVWLGDLGTDLPPIEANHWLLHNIPPPEDGIRGVSEMTIRQDLLNQFADPVSPEHVFTSKYEILKEKWSGHYGWSLYEDLHEHDQYALSIRLPRNDQDIEGRDQQIASMQKLLIEYLNNASISGALRETNNEVGDKSITLLDILLKEWDYIHRDRTIKFLRDLQKWRSKTIHKKSSSYDYLLEDQTTPVDAKEFVEEMLHRAISMLEDLIQLPQ